MINTFQQVINNIRKLMDFYGYSLVELSKLSGLTLNGLRYMFENGTFRIESLVKLSNTFHVPISVFFADEISITEQISSSDYRSITIRWQAKDVSAVKTKIKGNDVLLNIIYAHPEKRQQKEDEVELVNLRIELKEKNDKIEYLEFKNKVLESTAEKMENVAKTYEKQLNFYDDLLSGLKEKLENPSKSVE